MLAGFLPSLQQELLTKEAWDGTEQFPSCCTLSSMENALRMLLMDREY